MCTKFIGSVQCSTRLVMFSIVSSNDDQCCEKLLLHMFNTCFTCFVSKSGNADMEIYTNCGLGYTVNTPVNDPSPVHE